MDLPADLVGSLPQWLLTLIAIVGVWIRVIDPWLAQRRTGAPDPLDAMRSAIVDLAKDHASQSQRANELAERLDRHLSLEERFQTDLTRIVTELRAQTEAMRAEAREDKAEIRAEMTALLTRLITRGDRT